MQFNKIHQKLAKPVYEAIPKIAEEAGKKWKWKPEVGETCIDHCSGEPMIIYAVEENKQIIYANRFTAMDESNGYRQSIKHLTPLFHWEDHLEPTLEGLGWDLWDMERTVPSSDGTGSLVVVELAKGNSLRCGRGKDRQEAFQRATLAVAEELEDKK